MSGTLSEIVDLAADPADGLVEQIEAAGIVIRRVGGTRWYVSDVAAARAIAAGYSPLAAQKRAWIARLDAEADARLSLPAIMRAGSATNVTAAQISGYLAQATNRYRTLRTAGQSAANLAALQALDPMSGWPSNP